MVKGETVMPVPEGIISTSTGPAEAVQEVVLDEAIAEADAEEAVEEYKVEDED
jgi:hypothetical protein